MLISIPYFYVVVLGAICVGFGYVAGYAVGRLDLIWWSFSNFQKVEPAQYSQFANREKREKREKPRDFVARAAEDTAREKIEIDERKFVTAIKTADFVKNEKTTLGKTTESDDDIGASVSKLAQLKGK
jgi:hypothetical protein